MDVLHHPESLRGKRYIAYARCATKQGSTQSLRRQLRLIRQFADRCKLRCVAEVRLHGVDGYSPALRNDLGLLLARKCNQDDFEVLVMEDCARLTRADPMAAGRIEALFAACGVQIVYLAMWRADGVRPPHRQDEPRRRLLHHPLRAGSSPDDTQTARSR